MDEKNSEEVMAKIIKVADEQLDKNEEAIQEILKAVKIDRQTYRQLVLNEVYSAFCVHAMFAVGPNRNHEPEELYKASRAKVDTILRRDKRIFVEGRKNVRKRKV
ncbi:MAG TPA: hypothetical protein ENG66_04055 [Thermococcus sp.]|nr:hypothetical protein [Thermococcus sp.]